MAKYATLNAFWQDLDDARRPVVLSLRDIILATVPALDETLKWNAPSYALKGEDRVTFNLAKADVVRLVLHAGAKRTEDKKGPPLFVDETGMLSWQSDIRALVTFRTLAEVEQHREDVEWVVRRWLEALG